MASRAPSGALLVRHMVYGDLHCQAIQLDGHLSRVISLERLTEHHLMGCGSQADLTERVLGARLAKPQELRLSDWEARPLSPAQASYAALDAFACLRIHEVRSLYPDVSTSCKACECEHRTASVL